MQQLVRQQALPASPLESRRLGWRWSRTRVEGGRAAGSCGGSRRRPPAEPGGPALSRHRAVLPRDPCGAIPRDARARLSGSRPEAHQHWSPAGATCCQSLLLDPDATIGIDLRKWLFLLSPDEENSPRFFLTMEPPGTAVRMIVYPGRARPSRPKLSVLLRRRYALSSKPCAHRRWSSNITYWRSRAQAPITLLNSADKLGHEFGCPVGVAEPGRVTRR